MGHRDPQSISVDISLAWDLISKEMQDNSTLRYCSHLHQIISKSSQIVHDIWKISLRPVPQLSLVVRLLQEYLILLFSSWEECYMNQTLSSFRRRAFRDFIKLLKLTHYVCHRVSVFGLDAWIRSFVANVRWSLAAKSLVRYLGRSSGVWLQLDVCYDFEIAENRIGERIWREVIVLRWQAVSLTIKYPVTDHLIRRVSHIIT